MGIRLKNIPCVDGTFQQRVENHRGDTHAVIVLLEQDLAHRFTSLAVNPQQRVAVQ
jgi:hypothetical protein